MVNVTGHPTIQGNEIELKVDTLSQRTKLAISVLAFLVYIPVFILIYGALKHGGVAGLATFPVLIMGWLYDARVGLLSSVVLILSNFVLFWIVGAHAAEMTFTGPGGMGSILLIIGGSYTGWVSSLSKRSRKHASLLQLQIRARLHSEEELRASLAHNQALVDALPDTILQLDRKGIIHRFHTSEVGGLFDTPEAIVGHDAGAIMPDSIIEQCIECIGMTLDTATVQVLEYQSGIHYYETRFARIDQEMALVIVRNVTQYKVSEQQRIVLAIDRERRQILSRIVNNISHDFRTPLSIINTHTYLLKHLVDSDMAREKLDNIEAQVTRLEKFVGSILTLAQLNDELTRPWQAININQLLKYIKQQFEPIALEKQIHLSFDLAECLPTIEGHEKWLMLVLKELVENAIHHTSEADSIIIRSFKEDNKVIIDISNTGAGIDISHLPYLFEPFYRIDSARAMSEGGSGLGLTIAQQVMQLHGGDIQIISSSDKEVIFRIHFVSDDLHNTEISSDVMA